MDNKGLLIGQSISKANNLNKIEFSQSEVLTLPFFINTLSLMYRGGLLLPNWVLDMNMGDKPLLRILGVLGKGRYFKDVMGCYREHEGGITKMSDVFINGKEICSLRDDKFIYENILNGFLLPLVLRKELQFLVDKLVFAIKFYHEKSTFMNRFYKLCTSKKKLHEFGYLSIKGISLLLFTKGFFRRVVISLTIRFSKNL